MKTLSSLAICLIIHICTCRTMYADYSSLTKDERAKVLEAFQKAKFYPYYRDLVGGKDRIVFKEIKRISERHIKDNEYEYIYEITADLIISDTRFQRIGEFVTVQEITVDRESIWVTAGKYALIGALMFLAGYAAASAR